MGLSAPIGCERQGQGLPLASPPAHVPLNAARLRPVVNVLGAADTSIRYVNLRGACSDGLAGERRPFDREAGGIRDEFEGTQPRGRIVNIGDDHEIVSAGFDGERGMHERTASGDLMIERASIFMACAFSKGDQ